MLIGGAITESLYDMLTGTKAPEKSADAVTERIMNEFERLGGGMQE